jgi:steroid delta-isomerase
MMPAVDAVVAFYESLEPATLTRLDEFYAAHASFKDPFNEVRGLDAIRRIFEHMFATLHAPRFVVTGRVADADCAVLIWEFRFGERGRERTIRGASHLTFDANGRISDHRDYWDAAEELYATLPLLGWLMRRLQRALRAPQPES